MAKPGKMKKKCEKYRNQGRKETNKELRAKRHEAHMKKFADRREAGKTYEYKPNPYKEGATEYNREVLERAEKNRSKRTEFDKMKSIMRKLQNEINAQKKAAKAAESSTTEKKSGGKNKRRKNDDN